MHILLNSLRKPERKIHAIKAVRQVTSASLKDAKEVVDRVTGTHFSGFDPEPQKILDGAEPETLRQAMDVLIEHGVDAEIVGADLPSEDLYEKGVMTALLLMGGDHWVGACESAISKASDFAAVTDDPRYDVAKSLLTKLHQLAVKNGLY